MNFLNEIKVILITGGTGTFGREFIKRILNEFPHITKIVIFARDEFKHFEMQNDPFFKMHEGKLRHFIGDVRDKERLKMAFRGVDLVVHAAALKQVPLCEYNPFEAVKTNIIGASNIIEVAIEQKVKKVVALSTDKACSPVNLYGATKLCSDKLFIAANSYSGDIKTKFSVVRYGNVMGSRGSIIPFFKKLIETGAKELPITDERMTRFWLKLEDAVTMVLDCVERSMGGELFVKKIPSIKITDLANAIAPALPYKIIGIRPGEKLHEMMVSKDDARTTVEDEKYYIILPQSDFNEIGENYKNFKTVSEDFEYNSGTNSHFLLIDEIKNLL